MPNLYAIELDTYNQLDDIFTNTILALELPTSDYQGILEAQAKQVAEGTKTFEQAVEYLQEIVRDIEKPSKEFNDWLLK